MAVDVDRVLRLRAAGFTVREIAELVKCSHGRIGQIIKAHEIPARPRARIRARQKTVTIEVNDGQVAGAAIKRALERSGWDVVVES